MNAITLNYPPRPRGLPVRTEIRHGKTLAFDAWGTNVAEWNRVLTPEEQVSYLTNPAQMWHHRPARKGGA